MASAPPITAGERAGEVDVHGLLQILKRNRRKIIASTLLGAALALGYLALAKPTYTASASLFIDPRNRKVVADDILEGGYGTDLALVESQVAILTSDGVLKRVVDRLRLASDDDYAPAPSHGVLSKIKSLVLPRRAAPDPHSQALVALAETIKVKRPAKTFVVDIDVSASSAAKASRIASALLDAYLADQMAAKTAEAKRINGLLDGRLDELRGDVRRAEAKLDDYRKANKIITSDGGIVTEQQLTKISGELSTARAVAAEAKARQDQIQLAIASGAGSDTLPDAIRSPLIQRLREQASQVARREASLSSQLQSRHPVLIEARSQLAEVKEQIAAELKRIATSAQNEYQIAASRERDLAAQLERAKGDVENSNTALIKSRALEAELGASREVLKTFLARAKETEEQQNVSTPDARVITPPATPSRPSRPIAWLALGLGLIGGLGAGLARALISDSNDSRVRSSADLLAETGNGALSVIPTLAAAARRRNFWTLAAPAPATSKSQFSDLMDAISDPKSPEGRPYRQSVLRLLARIKSWQRPGRPHIAMLVSPRAGAGTSATTLAAAYAAALAGERVLLVDAASSNPELSSIFATTLKPTNIVVLDNKEHLARITTRDAASGLSFLPIALADLRMLKTQQRRRLMAGLNGLIQSYDLVLIDGGAILEDESATSLLPSADQVLIVARSGVTERGDIARALQALEGASDRVSGAVLTMTDADAE